MPAIERDDPERRADRGERRPLLDVRLDEAAGGGSSQPAARQLAVAERREGLARA